LPYSVEYIGKLPIMISNQKKPELIVDLCKDSKLKGFIVINNTNLGPAQGGTRIASYPTTKDALTDALKLAEAMTYKCAIVGLAFGGGKGVIVKQPGMTKKEILKEYALQVNKLKGKFYTGEDVGMEEADVQYMMKFGPYFNGKTGLAGDPSYFAALSVFHAIKKSLDFVFHSEKINGRSFAIKGVGKTGTFLAKFLSKEGGKVYVYDIDESKTNKLIKENKNILAGDKDISEMDVDIFCPCALGNDITSKNVNRIRAKIVCGTANNQLETIEVGDRLFERGILHVPDYVANAGGLINVSDELMPGGYNRKRVLKKIDNLKNILESILRKSKRDKISPIRVANRYAESIFLKKKEKAYAH